MAEARSRIFRWLFLPLFALSSSAFVLGVPPASAAVWSPSTTCDEISGVTLGLTDDWRIVMPTPRHGNRRGRVVSCDRTRRGPAQVRWLGFTAWWSTYGGSVMVVRGMRGDLALLSTSSSASGGSRDLLTLVDLRRGTSKSLGEGIWNQNPTYAPVLAALGGNGSLAVASWSGRDYPGSGGPMALLGADGALQTAAAVHEVVPSESGAYFRTVNGQTGKVAIAGPVPPTALAKDPSLRRQQMSLPRVPRRMGMSHAPLPSSTRWDTTFQLVRQRTPNRRGSVYVLVTPDGVGQPTSRVELMPGSGPELKVLAAGPTSLLVAGRFADAAGERRIRLLSAPDAEVPAIDLPASPSAELPGRALFAGPRAVVIADGDELRIWGAQFGSRAVPGVQDLAVSDSGREVALYFTDAAGRVERIPLTPN